MLEKLDNAQRADDKEQTGSNRRAELVMSDEEGNMNKTHVGMSDDPTGQTYAYSEHARKSTKDDEKADDNNQTQNDTTPSPTPTPGSESHVDPQESGGTVRWGDMSEAAMPDRMYSASGRSGDESDTTLTITSKGYAAPTDASLRPGTDISERELTSSASSLYRYLNVQQKEIQDAFTAADPAAILSCLSRDDIDVDSRDHSHGLQTYMMRLCHIRVTEEERAEIFTALIRRGANVNVQDGGGRTALVHACIAEKEELVRSLADQRECDPNISDNDGNTALMYTVRSRHPAMVHTLLQAFTHTHLQVNHVNHKGTCALSEAEDRCDSEICKILINEGGADTRVLDKVTLPKDLHQARTPRSLTPDQLIPVRGAAIKRSPIGTPNRSRPPSYLQMVDAAPGMGVHQAGGGMVLRENSYMSYESERSRPESGFESEAINLLSDVQEDDGIGRKINEEEDRQVRRRRRRNSLSLPDLQENSSLVTQQEQPEAASPAAEPEGAAAQQTQQLQHPQLQMVQQQTHYQDEVMPGVVSTGMPSLEHQGTLPLVAEEDEEQRTAKTSSAASSVKLPHVAPVNNGLVTLTGDTNSYSSPRRPDEGLHLNDSLPLAKGLQLSVRETSRADSRSFDKHDDSSHHQHHGATPNTQQNKQHQQLRFPPLGLNVIKRKRGGRGGAGGGGGGSVWNTYGGASSGAYLRHHRMQPRKGTTLASHVGGDRTRGVGVGVAGASPGHGTMLIIADLERESSGLELTGSGLATPQYLKHRRK